MNFSNNCLRTGGFTLIELLVVVAIIALMVAFLAGYIMVIRDQAKDGRIMVEISQLRNIAQMMKKDDDSYEELCDDGNSTLNKASPVYGDQLALIENDIKIRQGGSLNLNCQDSANSYCLDVNLITPGMGRYCIDDDGHAVTAAESFSCATDTTTCQ